MMETINGGSNYMRIVQNSVHMNFNSTLYGLVTPPRRTIKTNKRMSMPAEFQFSTPPAKVPELHSKSVPKCSAIRNSPSRLSPSQLDGKGFYAGAKFGERPLPTELPKPPNHWVGDTMWEAKEPSCIEMTNSLKVLLKVQA